MGGSADLEIGLRHLEKNSYIVELRFSLSNDPTIRSPIKGVATFDFDRLLASTTQPLEYGKLLTQSLFADSEVLRQYQDSLKEAADLDIPLHLRLFIWPGTPRLHDLYWETLCDPNNGELLVTNQNTLFSRFLSSSTDRRRLRLRPRGSLKALIAIANPAVAEGEYTFDVGHPAPINEEKERERACTALLGMRVETLPTSNVTLEHLVQELGKGYDLVYLVAHGGLINKEPVILLEDDNGAAQPASADALAVRIRELQSRPLLMVLASCRSASTGASTDDGALSALGPRLVEAGVPAVLAMQGDVSMSTIAKFMPKFFSELKDHGQIDRAVAAARGYVRDRADFWMPALYSRLQGARIWYTPGFVVGDEERFRGWGTVLDNIEHRQCTPILGSGLMEELIGPTWELAQRWAEQYGFPMASDERDDLPQVAQYLAVSQQQVTPRRELVNHLRKELVDRFGHFLPEGINQNDVTQVVEAAGRYLRAFHRDGSLTAHSIEPHAVLARLPFSIYLTTNPDTMLYDALREAGKTPTLKIYRWNDHPSWEFPKNLDLWKIDRNYVPDENNPLVYHLFGHINLLPSLVIKEDDYFDYLVGIASKKVPIPDVVQEALSQTALLFLGFRLEDWDFRALFRALVAAQPGTLLDDFDHVAAQVDPEESAYANPKGARFYLERYFRDEQISIYWGRVDDFINELQERWDAMKAGKSSATHA